MVVLEIKRKEGSAMITSCEEETARLREITYRILQELRLGVHRIGYKHLLLLIPCYVLDSSQSLSKELYPYAARHFGYGSWQPVEHAVRIAILDAWARRDPAVWEEYFPGMTKVPSNKQFIAAIGERIKNAPPEIGRG